MPTLSLFRRHLGGRPRTGTCSRCAIDIIWQLEPDGGQRIHRMGSESHLLRRRYGLYILSCPNLGKPVLDPMPITEWSLEKLNEST